MPIIDLHHEKEFDSGTKTKLDIFENYLIEWLPTFLFHNSEVNICDFFAGPGEDICHNPGSPLRIFNVIKKFENRILKQEVNIKVILNEQKKQKYEILKNNIKEKLTELGSDLMKLITVDIFNDDFKILFPQLESKLIKGPNLFFFDQNGVKQITVDFVKHLENFHKTDYLYFLSSSYFQRFGFEHIFPDLNIKNKDIKNLEIHRTIVEKFRELLPEDSKTQLYYFSIKKERNVYGLVFGSKHLLAVEKFLTVAWNKNKINGEANFDIDHDLDRQLDLFTHQPSKLTKLERFEIELKNFAKQRNRFTNKDVLHYTLSKGFIPKHAREILIRMRKSNHLKYFSHTKIGYKQIYKNRELLTFEYIK